MKYYNNAQIIKQPNEGQPFSLWISGQIFAHNLKELAKYKISAVCSVGSDPFQFPKNISHLYLQVEDAETQDITVAFDKAYEFIQSERKKSNVLVHCLAGISRSATILAYYLMRKYRWTAERSLNQIGQSRPLVRPNRGFIRQLILQQQKLCINKIRSKF